MPTFYIKHLTKYSYSSPVIDGASQIMLYPRSNEFQEVVSQQITVSGNPSIATYTDMYNNIVGTFMITEPHNYLSIVSEIEVKKNPKLFPDDAMPINEQWEALKALKNDTSFMDFLQYKTFDGTDEIKAMIEAKDLNSLSPYKIVLELCEFIYKNFNYIQGLTHVNSKLDEVWSLKAGVCQDFTHILLQMVRMLGIPARYVSGYICPSDDKIRGEGATHAWIEAYIPSYGWLGLDPTNNLIANTYHVKLAVGRSYQDCTPVKGVFKGNVEEDLFVKVKVSTIKSNIDSLEFPVSKKPLVDSNSYRQHLEMVQQQQQQ